MSDLASVALATAAGWVRTRIDKGMIAGPGQDDKRYETVFSKWLVGGTHQSGFEARARGVSDVSAADADTQALAALNNFRRHRYSADANVSTDTKGTVLVRDAS